MMFRFLIVIIGVFSIGLTYSQTCCSGGIPLSNNIGLEFSEDHSLILGLSYDFNNLNTLKNDSETLDDDSRLRTTHSVLVNAGYSFSKKLSIEGLFTWVNQRRIISQFDTENLDQTYGIGDAIVLARYKIINNIEKNWSINLGFGVKIPVGSSTETNDQGITLNADLQPGSNAWDLIYLLGASKTFDFRPTMTFSTRVVYRQPGENTTYFGNSTYQFGDELQAYISLSDQFIIKKTFINPGITFKYRNATKDRTLGFDIPNTGGDWVFIIPNFSIQLFQNASFNAAAELPLYSRPDGIQLTPTYRLTTGLLFNLFNKPQALIIN
ncbi:transporter [uncultured Winogradskyella sp.]|uniref:transporter n=1 Tax=uncultured Winogradskyella sp. TaxID=395353 RepID=UPI002637D2D2|nr:transporter [uncultured Winogradskyella sp.]